jgi:hypothetical protein
MNDSNSAAAPLKKMYAPTPLRLAGSTFVGILLGVAVLMIFRLSLAGLQDVAYALSYPGIRLGRLWTDSGLPPHGEGAFGVIALTIVMQWTFLGFVAGFCWRKRVN